MLRKKQLQRKGENRQKSHFYVFSPNVMVLAFSPNVAMEGTYFSYLLASVQLLQLEGGNDRSGIERKSSFWPPEKDPLRLFFPTPSSSSFPRPFFLLFLFFSGAIPLLFQIGVRRRGTHILLNFLFLRRELRCLRNKIHLNLFISYWITDLCWIIAQALQVRKRGKRNSLPPRNFGIALAFFRFPPFSVLPASVCSLVSSSLMPHY